jgi:hypothetical protein
MDLLSIFQSLNDMAFSVWLREEDWPFPIIETIHILGLGLSVGTIMWVDLRLLGLVTKHHRVSDIVGQLEPLAIIGFVVMFVSGLLLFISEPLKCYTTVAFQLKAIMLVLTGLNVWYFHAKVYPGVAEWDATAVVPWRAKMVGLASIVLGFGIIIAGRWTAYV